MIATTVQDSLSREDVPYTVVPHPTTFSAMRTAAAAHVPGDKLAKSVLLEDERGRVVAVVPSTHRLDIESLDNILGRKLHVANEDEIATVFSDCARGAIPAIGPAYGVFTVVDATLTHEPDVYFEAGDHHELVHVSGDAFRKLMGTARVERCSHHV